MAAATSVRRTKPRVSRPRRWCRSHSHRHEHGILAFELFRGATLLTCAHARQARHVSACDDGADPRSRRSRPMLADRYRAKSEEIVERSSDRGRAASSTSAWAPMIPHTRMPRASARPPGGPIREGDARGRARLDVPALDRRAQHGLQFDWGADPVTAGRPRRSSVVRPLACPHRSRLACPIAGPTGTQADRRGASGSASGPSSGRRPPKSSVHEAGPTPEDRIVVRGCAGNLSLPHASSTECSVPFPSAAPPGVRPTHASQPAACSRSHSSGSGECAARGRRRAPSSRRQTETLASPTARW
jgi:hypothetical protein